MLAFNLVLRLCTSRLEQLSGVACPPHGGPQGVDGFLVDPVVVCDNGDDAVADLAVEWQLFPAGAALFGKEFETASAVDEVARHGRTGAADDLLSVGRLVHLWAERGAVVDKRRVMESVGCLVRNLREVVDHDAELVALVDMVIRIAHELVVERGVEGVVDEERFNLVWPARGTRTRRHHAVKEAVPGVAVVAAHDLAVVLLLAEHLVEEALVRALVALGEIVLVALLIALETLDHVAVGALEDAAHVFDGANDEARHEVAGAQASPLGGTIHGIGDGPVDVVGQRRLGDRVASDAADFVGSAALAGREDDLGRDLLTGESLAHALGNALVFGGAKRVVAGDERLRGQLEPDIVGVNHDDEIVVWKRAFCSATLIGSGGVGGVAGSLMFRSQDAPGYRPGIIGSIACGFLVLFVICFNTWHFKRENVKADGGEKVLQGHPDFRYTNLALLRPDPQIRALLPPVDRLSIHTKIALPHPLRRPSTLLGPPHLHRPVPLHANLSPVNSHDLPLPLERKAPHAARPAEEEGRAALARPARPVRAQHAEVPRREQRKVVRRRRRPHVQQPSLVADGAVAAVDARLVGWGAALRGGHGVGG
ncbi:hypothetical protein BN1723_004422 [Verticillium longisporum]|uniref:Uncharacterized protein n=1 Tax=Verticillium longisporum TaxID=100787 RepID=A0A0G4MWR7_VERLO|nr:hypothetical protein BN1723_004422 [Verticillium longisporum]